MKDPRPSVTSARPFEAAFKVEKRSNTRIGSSDDRTVTAEPSLIRLVRPAIAASTTSGADTEKSGRWCSPTPKASMPSSSASTPSSITSRMTWACERGSPSGPMVMSPKVSSPNSKSCGIASLVSFKSAARAGGGMGAPVMFQQVGCGEHPCNAGAGGRAGPVFGQGGAQTGSILPAASCNSPNLPSGLISGRERGQIVQSGAYKPQ